MACQAGSSILPSRTMDPSSIRGTKYGASPGLAEDNCWAPAGKTAITQTSANAPTLGSRLLQPNRRRATRGELAGGMSGWAVYHKPNKLWPGKGSCNFRGLPKSPAEK